MTTLVALRHSRGVMIAADSACSDDQTIVRSSKVFRRGRFIVAFAGPWQGIRMPLHVPHDLWDYAEAMGRAGLHGIAMLRATCVAWEGEEPYEVTEYAAVGSGSAYALGALHCARAQGFSPLASVMAAIRAAATHDVWTRLPAEVYRISKTRISKSIVA